MKIAPAAGVVCAGLTLAAGLVLSGGAAAGSPSPSPAQATPSAAPDATTPECVALDRARAVLVTRTVELGNALIAREAAVTELAAAEAAFEEATRDAEADDAATDEDPALAAARTRLADAGAAFRRAVLVVETATSNRDRAEAAVVALERVAADAGRDCGRPPIIPSLPTGTTTTTPTSTTTPTGTTLPVDDLEVGGVPVDALVIDDMDAVAIQDDGSLAQTSGDQVGVVPVGSASTGS